MSAEPPADVAAADSEHDRRLAALLEGLLERHRRGEQPDVEAAARDHPELADELRQLWATVLFAHEFAPTADHPGPGAPKTAAARPTPTSEDGQRRPPGPVPQLPYPFAGYELVEELGRGGMGVVYKARDRRLNRTVALKVILRGEDATAEQLNRFRAEARAAGQLDHPNLVPVFDAGEADGLPYFVMKYVDGSTLSQLLTAGPLPPRDAARLLIPICRAVAFAHEKGFLHRD